MVTFFYLFGFANQGIELLELELLIFQGLTLLHWACDRGHPEIVSILLKAGANVNAQVTSQMTNKQRYLNNYFICPGLEDI